MAHMFDVMSTITGQINILSDYYINPSKSSIRKLPSIPEFVYAAIDRYISRHEEIIYNRDRSIDAKICILSDTNDVFNPVYLTVITNITEPIIDKISIHVNHKDQSGAGIGYLLGIPKYAFSSDADAVNSSELLRKIYFGILALDPNMEYKPTPGILRVMNSKKIDIKSYDIQMIYIALCFMNVVMGNWFGKGTKDIEEYTLSSFTPEEMPEAIRNKTIKILNKFGSSNGNIRDSIEKGDLLKMIVED